MSDHQLAPTTATGHSDPAADAAGVVAPGVLSVVTVTYNSRQEIAGCLDSLPPDLFGYPLEVILIDNASSDGTLEFVRANYPRVAAFSAGGNSGFGAANNLGFRRSTGEYLLLLNPDTRTNRAALEHCLRRLQTEPGIGIISPKLVLANGEMDLACRRSVPTAWDGLTRSTGLSRLFPRVKWCAGYNLTYLPEDATYAVGAVNGAFMMMHRRLFMRIGGFDERFFMYGEDLDICLRCSQEGFKVVYDGRHSVVHLKGCSSRKVHKVMSRALFTGTKQFYLKHFNPRNSRLVRWKYTLLFGLWRTAAAVMAAIKRHKAARPP